MSPEIDDLQVGEWVVVHALRTERPFGGRQQFMGEYRGRRVGTRSGRVYHVFRFGIDERTVSAADIVRLERA